MSRFAGLLGIIVLLSLAYLFSTNRRAIRLKTVLWGLGLQFVFAFLVIYSTVGQTVMKYAGGKVTRLLSYAFAGSEFGFGALGPTKSPLRFFFPFHVFPPTI